MKRERKVLIAIVISILALCAVAFGGYKWMNARNFQISGRIVSHADTGRKEVALTFDDGPSDNTPEILDMLDDLGIKCTFFLTGDAIEENMDQAKAIAAAGHQLGNHTYSHPRMIFKSRGFIDDEIDKTNELIRQAGYEDEIMFRPPFGKKLVQLPLALHKRDMTTVMWSIEPESYSDVAGDAARIADYVFQHMQSGDIILLHIMLDSGKASRDAVPIVVEQLQQDGYAFVTVSELLK